MAKSNIQDKLNKLPEFTKHYATNSIPSQLTTLAMSAVASGTEDVQLPGQASPSGALQERTHQQSSNNLHQKYMRGGVPAIGKDVQTSSMDSSLLGKEKHKKGLWKLTGKA